MNVALPAPALERYTRAQVHFAAGGWPLRAAEELRSALIYRALAASAAQVLAASWVERVRAVVADEVRHARICAQAGELLGAAPPAYDRGPVVARLAQLPDPRVRTAVLLLSEVAIGETISMTLFRAGRRGTTEPLSRAVLESILADEVRHQRLGWSALAALWPSLVTAEREALQLEASRTLAAVEQRNARPALEKLDAREPFDPAWAELGVLPYETRVDAFYFAVERFVVPRLTRLGLDGPRAWETRYRHSP
jgi:hypothetical protein